MAVVLGAGIGLKPQHFDSVLALTDSNSSSLTPWFEVHTENYFLNGGPRVRYLKKIAQQHPVSFHGVGASLGADQPLDTSHLNEVAKTIKEFKPALVSEHAVWSSHQQQYFAELLPMPKTQVALTQLVDNIDAYQQAIGRQICIENPTNYLSFISELDEPEFLVEAAQRSGCKLLLDVNNLYLSSYNCGMDATHYLNSIPSSLVGEIHIAGYSADANLAERLLIDSHAENVAEPVWQLLATALSRFGQTPVLIERDDNIPSFENLWQEQQRAEQLLGSINTAHPPQTGETA